MAEGLHAGAQLCAMRGGEVVGELALGLARTDTEMRHDTIVMWFSSIKPLMSVAIGQLVERGLLGFDDPAARHLPEFAANGKSAITIRDLLTHTAGIPNAHRDWSRESWDEIVAKICSAAPEPGWAIGRDCGYHVASAWYVLGEIVRRRDGRTYDRYVREAIFAPLGDAGDFWVGMPAADHAANRARIGTMWDAAKAPLAPHAYWAWTGSAESVALCRPGGSGWGTARAFARFWSALARGGAPLLRSDTLECMSRASLPGVRDRVFGVLNRGLGFVRDSKEHGAGSAWYGHRVSARAFGHAGYFSSVAFADPARGLAVALATNGIAPTANDARMHAALDALHEDLGLE